MKTKLSNILIQINDKKLICVNKKNLNTEYSILFSKSNVKPKSKRKKKTHGRKVLGFLYQVHFETRIKLNSF